MSTNLSIELIPKCLIFLTLRIVCRETERAMSKGFVCHRDRFDNVLLAEAPTFTDFYVLERALDCAARN